MKTCQIGIIQLVFAYLHVGKGGEMRTLKSLGNSVVESTSHVSAGLLPQVVEMWGTSQDMRGSRRHLLADWLSVNMISCPG
jgi:hypothetical protein